MRKLNKNNNASFILASTIIILCVFIGLEFFMFGISIPQIEEPDDPDMGLIGLGIIPWFQTQLGNLGNFMSFNFQIFSMMGDIGGLIRGLLWVGIIIGVIDLVWIG